MLSIGLISQRRNMVFIFSFSNKRLVHDFSARNINYEMHKNKLFLLQTLLHVFRIITKVYYLIGTIIDVALCVGGGKLGSYFSCFVPLSMFFEHLRPQRHGLFFLSFFNLKAKTTLIIQNQYKVYYHSKPFLQICL